MKTKKTDFLFNRHGPCHIFPNSNISSFFLSTWVLFFVLLSDFDIKTLQKTLYIKPLSRSCVQCYECDVASVILTWYSGRWGTAGLSDSPVVNAGSSGTGLNSPATQTCTPPPAAPSTCSVTDLQPDDEQITDREKENEKQFTHLRLVLFM